MWSIRRPSFSVNAASIVPMCRAAPATAQNAHVTAFVVTGESAPGCLSTLRTRPAPNCVTCFNACWTNNSGISSPSRAPGFRANVCAAISRTAR